MVAKVNCIFFSLLGNFVGGFRCMQE